MAITIAPILDDGYVDITIEESTTRVDLYQIVLEGYEAIKKGGEDVSARIKALQEVYRAHGLPSLSFRATHLLWNQLCQAHEEIGKNESRSKTPA